MLAPPSGAAQFSQNTSPIYVTPATPCAGWLLTFTAAMHLCSFRQQQLNSLLCFGHFTSQDGIISYCHSTYQRLSISGHDLVTFEFPTIKPMNNIIFLDVMSYTPVIFYQHFGGIYWLYHHGWKVSRISKQKVIFTLMMTALCSFETAVNVFQTVLRQIQEDVLLKNYFDFWGVVVSSFANMKLLLCPGISAFVLTHTLSLTRSSHFNDMYPLPANRPILKPLTYSSLEILSRFSCASDFVTVSPQCHVNVWSPSKRTAYRL